MEYLKVNAYFEVRIQQHQQQVKILKPQFLITVKHENEEL